ncbi:MAG: LCP family protein [Erysipelotrichaceae bacterium]|nr:LCP family protein [Erysipelotrichaceae bacterium]
MKKQIKKIAIIVIAILLIICLGVNIYVDSLLNKMDTSETINDEEINVYVPEKKKESNADNVVNFLLVGADNLDPDNENSWSEERSDVMKVISLDYTSKTIKISSLSRDVIVYFPTEGYEDFYRFNWAFSYEGSKLCMATINYNFDLDINKYVSMSFLGFKSIIDYIGGVDIKLSEQEAAALSKWSSNTFSDGTNHLNGEDALRYARLRSIDDDIMRMARQNIVIKAIVNKLKETDYITLIDIITHCLEYVHTNLTNDEIKKYVLDAIGFDLNNIETMQYPSDINDSYWNDTTSMGGYVLNDYIYEVERIHRFIYNDEDYEVSQNVKNMNFKIHKVFAN